MSDQNPIHSDLPDGNVGVDQGAQFVPVPATSQAESEPPKVVGYCRACGTALNEATVRVAQGSIFCPAHVPVPSAPPPAGSTPPNPQFNTPPRTGFAEPRYADSPYTSTVPPAQPHANPVAAFWLGLIPGVGAIYNAQYAKGMAHVVMFGLLISLADGHGSLEPLFVMLIPAFVFYMAFEAHHTARNRRDGLPVDEFSGLVPGHLTGQEPSRFPVAPVVLIVAGVVFLLDSLEILQIQRLEKFWPVLLILLGAYLLYLRTVGWSAREANHLRQPTHPYTHSPAPDAKREPSDRPA
ncbi:MAG: DUF5668 domain-containing protein [Acidobacteriota bacterium]